VGNAVVVVNQVIQSKISVPMPKEQVFGNDCSAATGSEELGNSYQ
jgi:hypothetical protein